jgi:hypothetical protein
LARAALVQVKAAEQFPVQMDQTLFSVRSLVQVAVEALLILQLVMQADQAAEDRVKVQQAVALRLQVKVMQAD